MGSALRVLIVEDEALVARPLQKAFEREGYLAALCDTGAAAVEMARTWGPDVILLDLRLPDVDGTEVAAQIRAVSSVPIIMVTARASEADRVRGFEIGADDYVVKPFSTPELVARVRAVSRRASNESAHDGMIGHADLRLDLAAHRAWNGDEELHLSRKEFELLRMLMMRPAEVVRRDELVRAIWNVPLAEGAASLDVHVSWLRAKLGDDPRRPRYIETVRGIGLRLVGGSP